MAFPDEPLGGPVPSGETSPLAGDPNKDVHDEAWYYNHGEQPPDFSAADHVSGEVITASQTHIDETQAYADDWSSSYSQPVNAVTLTPPEPPPPARPPAPPPGGSGKPPRPPEPPDEEDEEEGMSRMSFLE